MPARNIYHDTVVKALQADGWTITHDPLRIGYGGQDMYVDLGADRPTIGAERGKERIAVEIQSFLSPSRVRDLQEAIGQYEVYRLVLAEQEPDRQLFMAVPNEFYDQFLTERFGQFIISQLKVKLVVFEEERILQWKK